MIAQSKISSVRWFENQAETDFFKTIVNGAYANPNLHAQLCVNQEIPPFELYLDNAVFLDGVVFTITHIALENGTETDITSQITITKVKNTTNAILQHKEPEIITLPEGSYFQLRISCEIPSFEPSFEIWYSNAFCAIDIAPAGFGTVDYFQNGFDDDTAAHAYVVDGGFDSTNE